MGFLPALAKSATGIISPSTLAPLSVSGRRGNERALGVLSARIDQGKVALSQVKAHVNV